ncbi:hypothetical protein ANAPC4_00520 [Anaplasma phagocytophilum]|nr:hypothetical protein ANAPC4_00520 [Anaplasma phagocytophilum]
MHTDSLMTELLAEHLIISKTMLLISLNFATAQFSLQCPISPSMPLRSLCTLDRNSRSLPLTFSLLNSVLILVLLPKTFHKRSKYRHAPSTPQSVHSISRSGGVSDNMNNLTVSAPYCLSISLGSTTFFFDLLIFSTLP